MPLKVFVKIYKNDKYSPDEVVVYCFIEAVAIAMFWCNDIYINAEMISSYMFGTECTARNRKMVAGAIKSLAEKGAYTYNDGFINRNDFIVAGELYAMVPVENLQKILMSNIKNAVDVAYYYIWLLGTCNTTTKIGNQSVDYLANITGLSKSTILRYNKLLEDLDVIYFMRDDCASNIDGTFKHKRNRYGLTNNKAPNKSSNYKRSMAAKYNYIIRNPEKAYVEYGDDVVREVYEYYSSTDKDVAKLEEMLFFT